MKICLIYKVGVEFWINNHGCQPYPRSGHYVLNQLKNYSYLYLQDSTANPAHPSGLFLFALVCL